MLKEKIALVTGASSGIGRATALALGANGASVALVGRNVEELEKAAAQIASSGSKTLPLAADLTVEADRRRVIDRTVESFGGLDVLVNSAGIIATGTIRASDLVGPLQGMTLADLISAMRAGNTYANVHTDDGVAPPNTGPGDFPGGELRGQIR